MFVNNRAAPEYYDQTLRIRMELLRIRRDCEFPERAAVAQIYADTVNLCIETKIQSICQEFETNSNYQALRRALEELRTGTDTITRHSDVLFENDEYRTGPGFHRHLFMDAGQRIWTAITQDCIARLVPRIVHRLFNDFVEQQDIETTVNALRQLADNFDGATQFVEDRLNDLAPVGLLAARACARRLLPGMERAYTAIVNCMITAEHSLGRIQYPSILNDILRNNVIYPIMDPFRGKLVAVQYCHMLAYLGVTGVIPVLLPDCPAFFKT